MAEIRQIGSRGALSASGVPKDSAGASGPTRAPCATIHAISGTADSGTAHGAGVDLQPRVLMLTDIVDSTATFGALGEVAAARLWAEHDAAARDLLGRCGGQEIERGDGFLLLFDATADAARFAAGYHALLAQLSTPLRSRIGIHAGLLRVRANPADHVSQGARMLDLDGQAKATVARIQSLAQAGQTLVSAPAMAEWPDSSGARISHGYWQLKGLGEPLELFEIGPDASRFAPPPDAEKVWRVVPSGDLWRPARDVPHSLPAERDRFVGRTDYLARAAQALEHARLTSLLGTGGTGKTRLALRLGWQRLGDHPGGVWFCDLSAATTPDGIVHATAQGLELPLGAADPVAQVGDAIAGRGPCLVILDNFEQVARHAEATLGRWLQRAPQARFLVTTREVLGIAGEHTLALPPLPQDEGEALLRERAAQAGSLEFEPEDEAAVPELVRLLDGLPLAIELAASRMRVMGPAELLPRMNERFKLLASRSGRPDRQATLRATLDWSWELLTEPERSALAQLSVFEGGFTLEAAQAVVNLSEFAGSDADDAVHGDLWTIDIVQALVDKSLVRRVSEIRFDLLRSVQDYAAARLRASAEAEMAATDRFGQAMDRLLKYGATTPFADLRAGQWRDLDNLIAACRWAIRSRRVGDGARVLERAWAGLRLAGPYGIALELAEDMAATVSVQAPEAAVVYWVAGCAGHLLGKVPEARRYFELAFGAADATLDPARVAVIACALGELESAVGQVELARNWLRRADAYEHDDADIRCRVLNALGALQWECGALDDARRLYERAMQLAIDAGLARWHGALLGNIGTLAYTQGHIQEAADAYRESLAVMTVEGDRRFLGNAQCNLGVALLEIGDDLQAWRHLDEALAAAQHIGDRRLEASVKCNLGLWHERHSDAETATRAYRAAIEAAIRSGDPRSEGECRFYLGRHLARRGEAAAAEPELRVALDLLLQTQDKVNAAKVHCALAEIWIERGLMLDARESLTAAQATWLQSDLGPDSELGLAIRQVAQRLERQSEPHDLQSPPAPRTGRPSRD